MACIASYYPFISLQIHYPRQYLSRRYPLDFPRSLPLPPLLVFPLFV